MKFFHLSDLHIGKQLHGYSLKEDQEHILKEVVAYAKALKPDAVIIAGDIYDKSVPSAEAVQLFNRFLTGIFELPDPVAILVISGNHDSAERLRYAEEILETQQIYLAGKLPETPQERIKKVTLKDAYGEVDFYLLPFLKPSHLKTGKEEGQPSSYTQAVEQLLLREKIDFQRRNVMVSHQFYMGSSAPKTCDSEILSIGGLDSVEASLLLPFDYAALGHLHKGQKIKAEHIRYCGTLLKYSVSESGDEKTLKVVTLEDKGKAASVEEFPLHPRRDVKTKRGTLEEILAGAKEEEREDYVSITLTDEVQPFKPREQLERKFSHILEIKADNSRTRSRVLMEAEPVLLRSPLENFRLFYREIQGRELTGSEEEILQEICREMEE